jgi:signal transduction histidine kinase
MECQNAFAEKLKEKNLSLEIQAENPDLTLLADRASLSSSVINNLVSNSIKFSFPGQKVSISASASNNEVIVRISDRGMGMNPELQKKIFSKTEKTTRVGTQQEKGTGFGMPIVKKFMELYGGSISVESRDIETFPDKSGSEFTLHFKKASAT